MTALTTEKAGEIMSRLISAKGPPEKWRGAPFGGVKAIAPTNVGDVGEAFAVEALREIGYADAAKNPEPRGEWDISANGKTLEVKTASEDVSGVFQFNGVRYDTKFDLLLVVGIAPDAVHFNFYTRNNFADLTLVKMAKGIAGSYKLTRKKADLFPIGEFAEKCAEFLGAPPDSIA